MLCAVLSHCRAGYQGNEIIQCAAPGLGQNRVGKYLDIATSDRAPDDTALLAAADLESVEE